MYELQKLAINDTLLDPYLGRPPNWQTLIDENLFNNITGGHYLQETYKTDALQSNKFDSDHSCYTKTPQLTDLVINSIQNQQLLINLELFNLYYNEENPLLIKKTQILDAKNKLKSEQNTPPIRWVIKKY